MKSLSLNDADETTEDTEDTEEKWIICKDADRKPNGVGRPVTFFCVSVLSVPSVVKKQLLVPAGSFAAKFRARHGLFLSNSLFTL